MYRYLQNNIKYVLECICNKSTEMCESATTTSVGPASYVEHSNRPEDQVRVDDEELKPVLPGRRSKRNRVIYKSATCSALAVDKLPTRSSTVVIKKSDSGSTEGSKDSKTPGGKGSTKYPELRRHNTYL